MDDLRQELPGFCTAIEHVQSIGRPHEPLQYVNVMSSGQMAGKSLRRVTQRTAPKPTIYPEGLLRFRRYRSKGAYTCHRGGFGTTTATGSLVVLSESSAVLVYVLRGSGCMGRLAAGRVERVGPLGLNVFTGPLDLLTDYISGANLRSWCVLGSDRRPMWGWAEVRPEDRPRLFLPR